jgi:hypothetical protein
MRWTGHVACMRPDEKCVLYFGRENVYFILVDKPEGKRPLRRLWHRWEDSIRMDIREMRWDGVDWIHLAQDRNQWRALVNTVMKFLFPKRREIFRLTG